MKAWQKKKRKFYMIERSDSYWWCGKKHGWVHSDLVWDKNGKLNYKNISSVFETTSRKSAFSMFFKFNEANIKATITWRDRRLGDKIEYNFDTNEEYKSKGKK